MKRFISYVLICIALPVWAGAEGKDMVTSSFFYGDWEEYIPDQNFDNSYELERETEDELSFDEQLLDSFEPAVWVFKEDGFLAILYFGAASTGSWEWIAEGSALVLDIEYEGTYRYSVEIISQDNIVLHSENSGAETILYRVVNPFER